MLVTTKCKVASLASEIGIERVTQIGFISSCFFFSSSFLSFISFSIKVSRVSEQFLAVSRKSKIYFYFLYYARSLIASDFDSSSDFSSVLSGSFWMFPSALLMENQIILSLWRRMQMRYIRSIILSLYSCGNSLYGALFFSPPFFLFFFVSSSILFLKPFSTCSWIFVLIFLRR